MNTWWYLDDEDKKTGPIEADELKRLLQIGKIGPNTLLWHEGIENWQSLGEFDELKEFKAAVPPPLPPKAVPDPLSFPLATSWPRFFARMFDIWWEVLLVAFVVGAILGRYSASFVDWLNGPGASNVFGILCLPIVFILDALVYRFTGNTPGKALLGLKVGTLGGKPLSLPQYLGRNFSLWVRGLALGLPLFNLFTMAYQSGRLGKGRQTSWDEFTGFRVRSKPSGLIRKIAFGLAFTGLLVVMVGLTAIENESEREAILNISKKDYSWENPHTGLNATIDSKWKVSSNKNGGGQEVYEFSEMANRAYVVFAVEQAPGYTLHDYVQAFQANAAGNMQFADGGRFFERGGRPIWQGSGAVIDATSNRLNVQIVQLGSTFWRVVTTQTMPYEYSNKLVQQLGEALWTTTPLWESVK